jgi:hypothetical protein
MAKFLNDENKKPLVPIRGTKGPKVRPTTQNVLVEFGALLLKSQVNIDKLTPREREIFESSVNIIKALLQED